MQEQVKYKEPSWFGEQTYQNHDIPVYYRDATITVSAQVEGGAVDEYEKESRYDIVVCLPIEHGLLKKPLTALFWAGINMMYRHYNGFDQKHIHYTTGNTNFSGYEVWAFFNDPNRNDRTIQIKLWMKQPINEKYNN